MSEVIDWRKARVVIELADIINTDLDGFLDLIVETAWGFATVASEIEYEIVSSPTPHTVCIEVTAYIDTEEDTL
jgi:hypothetical protein